MEGFQSIKIASGTNFPSIIYILPPHKFSSRPVVFSRESDSTIANVCPFVRPKAKPFNSLKSSSSIINLSSFIILHSSFIILHSHFIILHSSFIIIHSSFLHFATFKLFSLFFLKASLTDNRGKTNIHQTLRTQHFMGYYLTKDEQGFLIM